MEQQFASPFRTDTTPEDSPMPQQASRAYVKPTILLVEDNMADARKIVRAAETIKWEHEIVVVNDGAAALRYVRGQAPYAGATRPSMILLDLNLPGLSGFEVLAAIKGDIATRRIPVVVISSSGEASDVSRAYEAHANAYLRKPVGMDALNQLARALQQFWFRMVTLPTRGEAHARRL